LIVKAAEQEAHTITIGHICTIGRIEGNDLVLSSTYVSKNHAVIRWQSDGKHYIVDLGSSNGTFLNDRRVTIPAALKSGDEIKIGECRLEFVERESRETPVSEDEAVGTQVLLQRKATCILVVDIRNYTGLSEAIPAAELSVFIGKWFKEVQAIIEQHGGEIDKYIGDAVMAVWKMAQKDEDNNYVRWPLETAKEVVALARDYDRLISRSHPPHHFAVGCGIHLGEAIVGKVGEPTVMGDCVNVAFRIEGLCKVLGHPILLSREVKSAAGDAFAYRDLGLHRLKGKSNDIHVFALKG